MLLILSGIVCCVYSRNRGIFTLDENLIVCGIVLVKGGPRVSRFN